MARFARRVIGALALEIATSEEIDADRSCAWQAALSIALTCVGAAVVCLAAFLLSFGVVGAVALPFSRTVR